MFRISSDSSTAEKREFLNSTFFLLAAQKLDVHTTHFIMLGESLNFLKFNFPTFSVIKCAPQIDSHLDTAAKKFRSNFSRLIFISSHRAHYTTAAMLMGRVCRRLFSKIHIPHLIFRCSALQRNFPFHSKIRKFLRDIILFNYSRTAQLLFFSLFANSKISEKSSTRSSTRIIM